jgi:hypothetical protein
VGSEAVIVVASAAGRAPLRRTAGAATRVPSLAVENKPSQRSSARAQF